MRQKWIITGWIADEMNEVIEFSSPEKAWQYVIEVLGPKLDLTLDDCQDVYIIEKE